MSEDEWFIFETLVRKAYPEFDSWLRGCFHQEWGCDHDSWQAAIDEYWYGGEDAYSYIALFIEELESLLKNFSEPQLQILFDWYGTNINGEDSCTLWLKKVRKRVKDRNANK